MIIATYVKFGNIESYFQTNKDLFKKIKSSLFNQFRKDVDFLIDLLATNGYNLREPYSKILRDGILELRSKVGSNISRVLYFLLLNNVLY